MKRRGDVDKGGEGEGAGAEEGEGEGAGAGAGEGSEAGWGCRGATGAQVRMEASPQTCLRPGFSTGGYPNLISFLFSFLIGNNGLMQFLGSKVTVSRFLSKKEILGYPLSVFKKLRVEF